MATRPKWATDVGLYQLLKELLFAMARGKGDYSERLEPTLLRLLQVPPGSFPEEFERQVGRMATLAEQSDRAVGNNPTELHMADMGPTERNDFTGCVLGLFEAMVEDRTRLGIAAGESRSIDSMASA